MRKHIKYGWLSKNKYLYYFKYSYVQQQNKGCNQSIKKTRMRKHIKYGWLSKNKYLYLCTRN